MENYSYPSYPDSGDSSPRSREIDFENPPPWEDQQPSGNYKVKFMCSYGGKIHPRPHDNQLSYIGGDTKILAVDRSLKFSAVIAKLSALADTEVSFKYQLPGEDLDALISVTNDDDLDHMMHEYDRLCRASAKPARLRLFLFAVNPPAPAGFAPDSVDSKSDRERFVEALNSGPAHPVDTASLPVTPPPNNVDFLFGLEKGVPPPPAAKLQEPAVEPEMRVGPRPVLDDRVVGSDPTVTPADIQRHIQDLHRLQLQDQAMYRRKSDDNMSGGYAGDIYVQKMPEKAPPVNLPVTMPGTMQAPPAYWPEKTVPGGGYAASGGEQQVYMIQAPAGMYHTQVARPVSCPTSQGYYQMQRMGGDVYREQPVYNVMTPPPQPQPQPQPQPAQPTIPSQPPKVAAYSEAIGMVRSMGGNGIGVGDASYAQVAYDSSGRQVYYTAPGGVMAPYPPMAAVSADMRPSQEGKMGAKVSQNSV